MIRNFAKSTPFILIASLAGLLSFTAVAFAANQTVPSDGSALDLLEPVYQAFGNGRYIEAGCLAIVLVVALAKRYGWITSKRGMVGLAFAGAYAATLAARLAASKFEAGMLWDAFKIAAGAAGGYAVLNELLVEPYLKPLQDKLPKWAQLPLSMLLWIFSKKAGPSDGEKAIAKAEDAGAAAVEAKPAQGAATVIGKPTEIE